MIYKYINILCLSFVIAGCASPLPRQAEVLAREQSCCARLSDFKFQELQPNSLTEAVIDENSSSFQFSEGKSYVAAFRLPISRELGRVLLKTYLTGFFVSDSQIFCPVVTFVDADYQPIGTSEQLPLTYKPPGWITTHFWYSVIEVPKNAVALLVHTPASVIGKPVTLSSNSSGFVFFTGKAYTYVPGGPSKQSFPCGQTGRVELEVR